MTIQPTPLGFVRLVACLSQDGEKENGTGDVFEMSAEDAAVTLANLIDMARSIDKATR